MELHAAGTDGDGNTTRLVLEGVVDAPDGRAWMFRSAALTPGEARTLGEWLLRAAKGRVELLERLTNLAAEIESREAVPKLDGRLE